MTGRQGVRVLGTEDPNTSLKHPSGQFAGGHVAAAEPQIDGDPLHAGTVRGQGRLGVRQQRRENRPGIRLVRRVPRVVGYRDLDQGGSGLPPLPGQVGGHLIGGDGLHQPVHRYQTVDGRADQRVPAQRGDRVTGRQRVLQQRAPAPAPPAAPSRPASPGPGLQQQPQRDRLRRAERQQPEQADRARLGAPEPVERQRPGGGHRLAVSSGLATGQQVGAPLPEQGQVPGQGVAGGLHVRGGLLQRQRQPAQHVGQLPGRLPVRVAGAADQETCRHVRVEHGNLQHLAGPVRVLAGDQHPAGPGRGQERLHRGHVRRVVEDQQPRRREPGQHRVHRRHRVPGIGQAPGAELGGQLAEPGRQHRGVLGGKLPRHPDLGPGDGRHTPPPRWSSRHPPARTTRRSAARDHHRPPAGHPAPPAAPPARPAPAAGVPAAPAGQPLPAAGEAAAVLPPPRPVRRQPRLTR